jgi:ABC-2 type transport system permease protein
LWYASSASFSVINERLLATPLKRWETVAGYIIGFGLFTTLQAGLIAWFAVDILDMMMEGSFLYVLLITFLLAMTALTLGTLLSAFANNELQMMQFIPLVVIPQIFFSGLFNLDTMAKWLCSLSVVMPLTYGADALREIMIRGNGWSEIAKDVYVLLGFAVLFMILNVVALKKHRKL